MPEKPESRRLLSETEQKNFEEQEDDSFQGLDQTLKEKEQEEVRNANKKTEISSLKLKMTEAKKDYPSLTDNEKEKEIVSCSVLQIKISSLLKELSGKEKSDTEKSIDNLVDNYIKVYNYYKDAKGEGNNDVTAEFKDDLNRAQAALISNPNPRLQGMLSQLKEPVKQALEKEAIVEAVSVQQTQISEEPRSDSTLSTPSKIEVSPPEKKDKPNSKTTAEVKAEIEPVRAEIKVAEKQGITLKKIIEKIQTKMVDFGKLQAMQGEKGERAWDQLVEGGVWKDEEGNLYAVEKAEEKNKNITRDRAETRARGALEKVLSSQAIDKNTTVFGGTPRGGLEIERVWGNYSENTKKGREGKPQVMYAVAKYSPQN